MRLGPLAGRYFLYMSGFSHLILVAGKVAVMGQTWRGSVEQISKYQVTSPEPYADLGRYN